MRMFLPLCLLALAGCSLNRPYPDQQFLALEPLSIEAPGATIYRGPIRVARARIDSPYGSRAWQYRIGPGLLRPSYYHRWVDDPGAIIAGAVAQALDASGAFVVLDEATMASAAGVLEIRVERMLVDQSSGETNVVLSTRTTLVAPSGEILSTRRFDETLAISGDEPGAIVRAWSKLLGDMLAEFLTVNPSSDRTTTEDMGPSRSCRRELLDPRYVVAASGQSEIDMPRNAAMFEGAGLHVQR